MSMRHHGTKDISPLYELAYLIRLVDNIFFSFCKAIVFI